MQDSRQISDISEKDKLLELQFTYLFIMSTSKIWLIWGSNSPILSEYSAFVWTSHWSDLIPDYVQQFMLVCLTKIGQDVCQKQLHLGIQWWFYAQWFSLCSWHITCSWFRFILKNITFHAYGYKVSSGFFWFVGNRYVIYLAFTNVEPLISNHRAKTATAY